MVGAVQVFEEPPHVPDSLRDVARNLQDGVDVLPCTQEAERLLSVDARAAPQAEPRFVRPEDLLHSGELRRGGMRRLPLQPLCRLPPDRHGRVEDALHHVFVVHADQRAGDAARHLQTGRPLEVRRVVLLLPLQGSALLSADPLPLLPHRLVVDGPNLGAGADPHPLAAPWGVPSSLQLCRQEAPARPVEVAGVHYVLEHLRECQARVSGIRLYCQISEVRSKSDSPTVCCSQGQVAGWATSIRK